MNFRLQHGELHQVIPPRGRECTSGRPEIHEKNGLIWPYLQTLKISFFAYNFPMSVAFYLNRMEYVLEALSNRDISRVGNGFDGGKYRCVEFI